MKNQLPLEAWAVLDETGSLAVWDYRVPICWMRGTAMQDKREHGEVGGKVVKVRISLEADHDAR